jgi:hypothetical protein
MEAGKDVPSVPAETLKGLLPGAVGGFPAHRPGEQFRRGRRHVDRHRGGRLSEGQLQLPPGGHRPGRDGRDGGHGQRRQRRVHAGDRHGLRERSGKVGGRLTTEEWDREAKSGRYSILVGDRFTVEANGNADSVDVLKQAVASVDAGRLEALAR